MSYVLRTLSLRDVARALKRSELRLALRISQTEFDQRIAWQKDGRAGLGGLRGMDRRA